MELFPPRLSHLQHLARYLWKPLLGLLLYSLLAVWLEANYLEEDLTLSSDMQAVASLFLGSLLALRLNTSYNKWWEARTLWGRLVNEERNLAAYSASLSRLPREGKARMRELLVAYPTALMVHLRREPGPLHEPVALSGRLFGELEQWKENGWVDGWQWNRLTLVAESLLQVCGGCERIRNSPWTRSYHSVSLVCIWTYLLAAPLALHHRFYTIPLVMALGTLFLFLEQIARDIDEPFGIAPEDLPLERLCQTIRATVEQLLPSQ
jgi:putative membrane protein